MTRRPRTDQPGSRCSPETEPGTARPGGRRWRPVVACVAALVLLAAACGDDGDEPGGEEPAPTTEPEAGTGGEAPDPPEEPGPEPEDPLAEIDLELEEVASLDEPTALAVRPGSLDLYVTEKRGTVRHIEVTEDSRTGALRHQLQSTPLLDLSSEVLDQGEQGLLGIEFSSDGRTVYLHHSALPDGATRVVAYQLGDGRSIDAGSERELLTLDQPFANHNGGQLALGPDGYLYIGLGDGGSGGDPLGSGQDASSLLGSILRIDPDDPDSDAYGIPSDNPFADGGGAPETWLYGVRNPWRFSFDAETGDLWVADVGQNAWEEITHLPAEGGVGAGRGANLGWAEMEGTHPFDGGQNPPDGVLPVHEYPNPDQGCSITGGYVYRGEAIAGLAGAYLFADYCEPGIRAIRVDGDQVVDEHTWDLDVTQVISFGEGDDRELYVLSQAGTVSRLVPPG